MFSTIEIKAYRGLRDVTLDGLGTVNILVGENNTGKTSILEAIQMFRNKRVLENVISIANKRQMKSMVMRGNLTPFDELLYSFPIQEEDLKEILLYAQDDCGETCRIELLGRMRKEIFYKEELPESEQRKYDLYCGEEGEIRSLHGNYLYEKAGDASGESYSFRETQMRPETEKPHLIRAGSERRDDILYISPMDIYNNRVLNASLYKGMRVAEKEKLIQLLRLFDDRIIGIEVGIQYGQPVILIEVEDMGQMPVYLFGDGLKKILTLASAIVKTEHGVILIDEFETGIHQRALVQVADWIASAAEQRDTQIFLTTHSGEAVNALVQAQKKQHMAMSAYRLEHYMGDTYVKQFGSGELLELVSKQGMDIL